MAGGNWTTQNKIRPGVYINFDSETQLGLTVGQRGVVAICEPMSWGPVGEIMEVNAGVDTTPYCGYPIYSPQALFLNEIFKGTDRTDPPYKVLLYRPTATSSAAATVTTGNLTATALYPGARGNDITIIVVEDVDNEGTFTVQTVVDGAIVDEQTGANVSDLKANAWVKFSGTGALAATAGSPLANGADGTVTTAAYTTFLTALEAYNFDILIYDGTDPTTMAAMQNFVDRLVSNEGMYCQLVAANMTNPDDRFCINVNVGSIILDDGTTITPQQACWWVGGAEAGAQYNQSLTYAQYPHAVDVTPRMTGAEIEAAILAGQLTLVPYDGTVKVEYDKNSLTTYTSTISELYNDNRTIRLCNTIANDIYQQFSESFIGVVNNNETGRSLFASVIAGYLKTIQNNQGIQNLNPEEDIQVLPGEQPDAIVINLAIQPVFATAKIYMTITVS